MLDVKPLELSTFIGSASPYQEGLLPSYPGVEKYASVEIQEAEQRLGKTVLVPLFVVNEVGAAVLDMRDLIPESLWYVNEQGEAYVDPSVIHLRVAERPDGRKTITYYLGDGLVQDEDGWAEGAQQKAIVKVVNSLAEYLVIQDGIWPPMHSVDTLWLITPDKAGLKKANINFVGMFIELSGNRISTRKVLGRTAIVSPTGALGQVFAFFNLAKKISGVLLEDDLRKGLNYLYDTVS